MKQEKNIQAALDRGQSDGGELVRGKKRYRSREAMEREAETQFGGKRGNPICPQNVAVAQREFYKWVMMKATKGELDAFLKDPDKPHFRKQFIRAFLKSEQVNDFCSITNQIYGMPKQTIEKQELPPIDMSVFGIKPKEDEKAE